MNGIPFVVSPVEPRTTVPDSRFTKAGPGRACFGSCLRTHVSTSPQTRGTAHRPNPSPLRLQTGRLLLGGENDGQNQRSAVSGQPPAEEQPTDEGRPAKEQEEPEASDEESETDAKDGVFFKDDLNSGKYEEGDPLPEWGEGVYALRWKDDGRIYIGAQNGKAHTIRRKIDFPENWSLEFTVIGGTFGPLVVAFIYDTGTSFAIEGHKAYWGWDIKFPGAAKKTVPYKTPDRWRITRSSGTWKLYVNDAFVASAQLNSGRPIRLDISLPADNAPILVGDLSGTVLQ